MSSPLKKAPKNSFRLSFFGAAQVDVDELLMSDKVGKQLDAMSRLMKEQRELVTNSPGAVTEQEGKN